MAKPGKAVAVTGPPGKAPRKPGSTLWLQGLACGALVTLAPPTAVLGGVLLVPSVFALLLDPARGKPSARPVVLLGLAASLAPIGKLWRVGHTMDVAWSLASDPSVLATAWVAQAAAWLVVEIAPLFIVLALEAAAKARAMRLRAARRRFEEEWELGEEAPDSPLAGRAGVGAGKAAE
jgi:hypothetical protein